jgi:hypothetical protein
MDLNKFFEIVSSNDLRYIKSEFLLDGSDYDLLLQTPTGFVSVLLTNWRTKEKVLKLRDNQFTGPGDRLRAEDRPRHRPRGGMILTRGTRKDWSSSSTGLSPAITRK